MPSAGEDPIDALYSGAPDDFVAARDALARTLRADGDREGAAAVRALRKPTRAAWAVNAAVRARPQAAGELADAARRLQDVQQEVLAGGDPALLRAADVRAREAVEAVAGASPASDVATVDKVHATLRAATVDPEVLEEVLSGRLARERVASGFGGFGIALAADAAAGAGSRGRGGSKGEGADGGEGASAARGKGPGGRGGSKGPGSRGGEGASAARGKGAGGAARAAPAGGSAAARASAAAAKRARAEEEKRRRAEERAARAAARAEQRRQERVRQAREREAEAAAEVDAARGALEQVEAVARERREQLAAAEARLEDARARVAREDARDGAT